VVNTGSMASLIGMAGTGDYTAAKFGVAGLTEVLRAELKDTNVGVSILCPGHTRTNLVTSSQRTMPSADARKLAERMDLAATAKTMLGGLDPRITGGLVLRALLENRFYIFSHPEYASAVRTRFEAIMGDVAWAESCLKA
jgi:short-subunit dehydrogenase